MFYLPYCSSDSNYEQEYRGIRMRFHNQEAYNANRAKNGNEGTGDPPWGSWVLIICLGTALS
jgi:hypothetical protein